jgi:tetratricopeptide (TPR) repeat protein
VLLSNEPLAAVDERQYEVTGELARGGMGRIKVARDKRLDRYVAIKEVLVKDGMLARRFAREARITARLQHPSIISVYEAGTWASGEPFYAMPLLKGESLDAAVARRTTLDQRVALVPHVLAVADAMAYAHEQRVIHRDLKPRNVLVGTYGETVVIDWGLAKELSAAEERFGTAGADGESVIGEVMGTPAYMPPEQANGDPVDARADVYAIGAMLSHVLTGAPPYEGASSAAVLDAVLHGPPIPVATREPGAPIELVAIIERSMARSADARYPTARELAEDLRRFLTGQLVGAHHYTRGQLVRRWLQRNRAASIAALVVVAVTAAAFQRVVYAKHVADEQRDLALANRADAEDLLEYMVVDLRDKLAPSGKVDLLGSVANKALDYYDHHAASLSERGKRALQLQALGRVLHDAGNLDAAGARFHEALATFDTLSFLDGDTPWRSLAGETHALLGQVEAARGASGRARVEADTSLGILQALPDTIENRRFLASTQLVRSELLLANGQTNDADAATNAAVKIADDLVAADPKSAPDLDLRHRAHVLLGDTYERQGNREQLVPERALELPAAQALVDAHVQHGELAVARAHLDLAFAAVSVSDVKLASSEGVRARAAYKLLFERDPGNSTTAFAYAQTLYKVGVIETQTQQLEAALADFHTEAAVMDALHAKDPVNKDWTLYVATSHSSVADILVITHDPGTALVEHRKAVASVAALHEENPTDVRWTRNLVGLQDRVGRDLIELGRPAEAVAALVEAEPLSAELVQIDPKNIVYLTGLVDEQERIEHAQLMLHDAHAARLAGQRAAATLATMESIIPGDIGVADSGADICEQLGDAALMLGDATGAVDAYRVAATYAEVAAKGMPDDSALAARVKRLAAKRSRVR